MILQSYKLLQGGKYRIERVLGQGGFGITYQAIQVALNRRVAIKEFFMKEYCGRDANTSRVTVGATGGAGIVSRFKEKFLKEAAIIAQFDNPHIVRIYDIFEENGTAYYVMEFLDDLGKQWNNKGMPQELALNVVHQVGEALTYIHSKNVLHLDVKPSNILFRKDCAVLIDFGISKRYDAGGGQTSTTPVGISKGFAPLEQYNQGVQKFLPATDVYSLGATLYKFLTGQTPPEASDVMNYGLPTGILQERHVPENIIQAIKRSMDPRLVQRYQNVKSFMNALGKTPERISWKGDSPKQDVEETVIFGKPESEKVNYAQNSRNTENQQYINGLSQNELKDGSANKIFSIWPLLIIPFIVFSALILSVISVAEKREKSNVPVVMDVEKSNHITSGTEKKLTIPLGECVYKGSVDAKGLPNGFGEAKFSDGRLYRGVFVNGVAQCAYAHFEYENGDIFEGSFDNNSFREGRYTLKEDGSYFKGTFKNGQPSIGIWYDKNGNIIKKKYL